MASKYELYRDLCIEAGTYTPDQPGILGERLSDYPDQAEGWYDMCSHNISRDLDESLELAALGDVRALVQVRSDLGLPIFG